MFGPPGHLYVYFTYGMHFCVNLVCHEDGDAAAVLLRALEPASGLEAMRRRRGLDDERQLCSGPAKLTQALGIGREHNGLPAHVPPALVVPRPQGRAADPATWSAAAPTIVATPRVGIGSAIDRPWRFVDADSRYLSRRLPASQIPSR
jgi:DNA-3-methyladenine glycosylase